PLPEPDEEYPNAAYDGINKIKEIVNAGTEVFIVDHHKVSETYYGDAVNAGANIIIASSAPVCFYGTPPNREQAIYEKWGIIGGICDRDKVILPLKEKEDQLGETENDLMKIAEGVDNMVREDMKSALDGIRNNNYEFFKENAGVKGVSCNTKEIKRVVIAEEVDYNNAFKQLDKLAEDNKKDYALGYCYSKGEGHAITIITYWKSNVMPAGLKLGKTRIKGHIDAFRLFSSEWDAPKKSDNLKSQAWIEMMEIAEKLNEGVLKKNHAKDTVPTSKSKVTKYKPKKIFNYDFSSGFVSSVQETEYEPEKIFNYVSEFMDKVNIPFFLTSHGWNHIQQVITYSRSLGSLFKLSTEEQKLLDFASLLHDIGNGATAYYNAPSGMARDYHHEYSKMMIEDWDYNHHLFDGILNSDEVHKIQTLVLSHRKKEPLPEDKMLKKLTILLRIADGMDIDSRRAQKNDKGEYYENIKLRLPPFSIPHWEGHRAIKGTRLHINKELLSFELLITKWKDAEYQIKEIVKEFGPLSELRNWSIMITNLE
ncbi:MAG: HD domain-containing protein, partial [Methanosarcinales archaeon]